MSWHRFTSSQKLRKIRVRNAPALADVDGAKRARFYPMPHSSLGHFKPVGNLLHCLVAILRHCLPPVAVR